MHSAIAKKYEAKEPSKDALLKLYADHQQRFDEQYKMHMFELGVKELNEEAKVKYDPKVG